MEPIETFGYEPWQVIELDKCRKSFSYFCEKYVKIIHPLKGLIPFKLYPFQERVISDYEVYPYNIVSKFRQAGLTTVTVVWALWRCLFKTGQRMMVVGKSDREAVGVGKIVQDAKANLPAWMQPTMRNDNDHEKEFIDTDSVIWFYTVQGVRSKALTYLIIDEAAFIQSMEEHWKALYPALSTGGKCIAISTVNGIGNWYHKTYTRAETKKNQFHIIDLEYTEHPDYNNPAWVDRTRRNLGKNGFLQEVMRSFLGSGETYIDPEVIKRVRDGCTPPKRLLFAEYDSIREENWEEEEMQNEDYEKGALWVWHEPDLNHEYVISADSAGGNGDDADNSAFHVIDLKSMEQVAEFYSNIITPHKFAQVLAQTSIFYNNALLIVEQNAQGLAVLNRLQHSLYYENIYYDSSTAKSKSGFNMQKNTRPLVLEALQTCLMSNLVKINSSRVVDELDTFTYNKQKQRPEATKGKHDDLVMALGTCLYVADTISRDMPVGLNETDGKDLMPKNVISEIMQGESFAHIKTLLEEGLPDEEFEAMITEEELMPIMTGARYERPADKLLKSFGWLVMLTVAITASIIIA